MGMTVKFLCRLGTYELCCRHRYDLCFAAQADKTVELVRIAVKNVRRPPVDVPILRMQRNNRRKRKRRGGFSMVRKLFFILTTRFWSSPCSPVSSVR